MAKKPYVGEMEDRMGVFTIGKVKDKYEAHEMFLDWYYDYMRDTSGRMYMQEYWSASPEQLDIEHIQQAEAMLCNGCGSYSIDDNVCFQCEDKALDRRTLYTTFYICWG